MDTARFLANYTNIITARQIHRIIKENLKDWLHNLVCTAAAGMEEEIKLRKVSFDPIKTSARLDGNSGKVRDIGVECIKQQIYDYVATNGLRELFERKIGTYQCASIPGRGQVYGKTAIENWIRKNPGKTRIAAKGDVRKCYPSINRRKLKRMLEKQVRNEDLLYLTFVLIDSFNQGLSIGSYLSQWLCNYYLSAAYHYAAEKLFKRKKHRDGTIEEIRLINHVLFYMDDFLLIGSRKADVRKAMKLLVKYMNENIVTETYSGGDPENPEHIEQAVYEYDFNQFRERQEKISEETVRASPEKYLEYIPKEEKSTEQKFAEQAEQIEMLKDCLLEMSELVYA